MGIEGGVADLLQYRNWNADLRHLQVPPLLQGIVDMGAYLEKVVACENDLRAAMKASLVIANSVPNFSSIALNKPRGLLSQLFCHRACECLKSMSIHDG
jgi:hypothetical protein